VKGFVRLAILTVSVLAASSASASAANVFVIHGIPGVTVDVYAGPAGSPVPGTPAIANFVPRSVVRLPGVSGAFDIRIYAAGDNPAAATPVITVLGATIPATGEISIVAHLDASGAPTASIYVNDATAVAAGWARVSVRHTADAPPVQLTANGVPKLAVSNPYFGDLEVPATTIPLQLQVPFTGAPITPTAPLTFGSGLRYFVYAIGSVGGGTFDFIIHATQ
jgi:hypothetical protein